MTDVLRTESQFRHQVILALHCGQWYQQKQRHFRAHRSMPKAVYCPATQLKITAESTDHFWSSSREYLIELEKCLQISKKHYERYRQQCLAMADDCFYGRISLAVPLEQSNRAQVRLVFLVSSARICVVGGPS